MYARVQIVCRVQVLIQQGSSERRLMVILKGTVLVQAERSSGTSRTSESRDIASLGPGNTVGDIVFIKGGVATATVRCSQHDVWVLQLPSAHVLDQRLRDQESGGTTDVVDFYHFLAVHLANKLRQLNISTGSLSPSPCSSPAVLRTTFEGKCSSSDDEDICKIFNIHASEYVMIPRQAAALVHHGKRALWGLVCATQSYLCFHGDLFGQSTKFAFHFSKIRHISDIDRGGRSYVEICVDPQHADDDDLDSSFLFYFSSSEGRDLFSFDVQAAYEQTHVWKQSRGCVRTSYQIYLNEDRIFLPTSGLTQV